MVNTWSRMWRIGTRLISNMETKEWQGRGYVPLVRGSNVYFAVDIGSEAVLAVDMPLYLDCAYEDMEAYLDKTYEGECCGHAFYYRLQRNRSFIEDVEHGLLSKIASLYCINRPLIFAPEARRAVDVCITEGLTADELAVNAPHVNGKLQIDASVLAATGWRINNLGGILRVNQRLVITNVKLSAKAADFTNDGENADGEHYYDVRGILPDSTLILPYTPNLNYDVRRIEVGKVPEHAYRVYVSDGVDLRQYHTLTFSDTETADWINTWQNGNDLPRLRTAGDIDAFCKRFTNNNFGFTCEFDSVIEPNEPVPKNVLRRYERRDRYPGWGEIQDIFHARRYRPVCYLRFRGNRKYLTDWAEYVLSACEHEYPEFSWAGVTDAT